MDGGMKLALVTLIAAAAASTLALSASGAPAAVEDDFVAAANRGDYARACHLYSRRYLKASQETCRSLYRWEASFYGPYDYRIVRRRMLRNGRRHVELILRHHRSFIELARERAGWRIVAGGW
jgi:hypothetical protein